MLRLLQLPDFIQAALRDERISAGHARSLINVKTESDQKKILSEIEKKSLSVRQTEDLVKSYDKKSDQKKRIPEKKENPFLNDLTKQLRNKLSTKVNIKQKAKGGEIRIEYYSNDDLERQMQLFNEMD
jgi:ParB family chromosome partitioning protein